MLPLLQQKRKRKTSMGGAGGSQADTVEGRVIGAGLEHLKGAHAEEAKKLFFVFAVSKEDHLHSAPVIELLWRSCRREEVEEVAVLGAEARMRVLLFGARPRTCQAAELWVRYARAWL